MSVSAHTASRGERPVLITDAGMSRQDEFKLRRRRYDILMAGRVLCVIAAFVVGTVWSNVWLAGVFIAGAAVLPWAAVLIANDRLPIAAAQRRTARRTPPSDARQLELMSGPGHDTAHPVIES